MCDDERPCFARRRTVHMDDATLAPITGFTHAWGPATPAPGKHLAPYRAKVTATTHIIYAIGAPAVGDNVFDDRTIGWQLVGAQSVSVAPTVPSVQSDTEGWQEPSGLSDGDWRCLPENLQSAPAWWLRIVRLNIGTAIPPGGSVIVCTAVEIEWIDNAKSRKFERDERRPPLRA